VTVAVVDPNVTADAGFDARSDDDFRIEWFSGSGAGGQHRNKHQNSCRVHHIPTGLSEARQGRERNSNLRDAKEALIRTLDQQRNIQTAGIMASERKGQVGSGMRGDKSVTIRFQDDKVVHENGRTMSAQKYMRGHMDEVWS
jgi:protein subunit release factor A